jgi:hypothetical protein
LSKKEEANPNIKPKIIEPESSPINLKGSKVKNISCLALLFKDIKMVLKKIKDTASLNKLSPNISISRFGSVEISLKTVSTATGSVEEYKELNTNACFPVHFYTNH